MSTSSPSTSLRLLTLAFVTIILATFATLALADLNANCAIIIPRNPLTAAGLATPFYFTNAPGTNAAGPCNMSNFADQASFVQGAILDLDTGTITVYNPLVIDVGKVPLLAPVVPTLPTNNIVGLWFGSNADTLTLLNTAGTTSLQQGKCVNGGGSDNSVFGQAAFCNAKEFFAAAQTLINAGKLQVPALGVARDGLVCPTTRDYFVVDQDPSDNVITTYLLSTATGATAQDTPINRRALQTQHVAFTIEGNGSDNRLLDTFLQPALNCAPFTAADAAANAQSTNAADRQQLGAVPLNELQAIMWQQYPQAMVVAFDPMTETGGDAGNVDLNKLNLFRNSVGQPNVTRISDASPLQFCLGLLAIQPYRLELNRDVLLTFASPAADTGNNLYTFLVARLIATLSQTSMLCVTQLGLDAATQLPYTVTTDAATGAVTAATYNPQVMAGVLAYLSKFATANAAQLKGLTTKQLARTRLTLSPVKGVGPTDISQLGFAITTGTSRITVPLVDNSGFVNVYVLTKADAQVGAIMAADAGLMSLVFSPDGADVLSSSITDPNDTNSTASASSSSSGLMSISMNQALMVGGATLAVVVIVIVAWKGMSRCRGQSGVDADGGDRGDRDDHHPHKSPSSKYDMRDVELGDQRRSHGLGTRANSWTSENVTRIPVTPRSVTSNNVF